MDNRMSFVLWGAVLATAGCSMAAPPPPQRDPWDVIDAMIRDEHMRFNERSASGDLYSATVAQANFAIDADGAYGDPACLAQKRPTAPDAAVAPRTARGYRITFHAGPRSSAAAGCGVTAYAYVAVPEQRGVTGLRSFCLDNSAGMRASTAAGVPVVAGGRCPPSWALAEAVPFPARPVSDLERRAALKTLDDDPRSEKIPDAVKETIRALLADTAPAAGRPAAAQAGRAHAKAVYALAFTPDGKALVSGGLENPEIKVWSVPEARLTRTWKGECGMVTRMVVAPDANTLVASCGDQSVKLVSLTTGKVTATLGNYGTVLVSLSATGDRRSVLTSARGKATVVALPGGTRGPSLDVGGSMMTMGAVSRDGTMAAAGSMATPVGLWALPGGQPGTLDPSSSMVHDLVFSPDGRFLAGGFEDGNVWLWDTATRRRVWNRKEHGFAVNGVSFTPDGMSLVTASSDHTVKVWSVPLGKPRMTLRGHDVEVFSLALSPDGRTAASGDTNGVVMLWDLASGSSQVLADPAVR